MIEVTDLSKDYKVHKREAGRKVTSTVHALKGITLSVAPGEVLGILGPNGAGKTTLVKLLAGLLRPTGGRAWVNGFSVEIDQRKVQTSVNILRSGGWIVFDYKLSVEDNLTYWAVIQGVPRTKAKARAQKVIDLVGLSERGLAFPEQLSAGMRQRMSLARCLLVDRPVYLLDEPTANIDPVSAQFLRTFIREKLAARGRSVILATHNLVEAESACDRVLILRDGEVIVQGNVRDLAHARGEPYALVAVEETSEALMGALDDLSFVTKTTLQGAVVLEGIQYQLVRIDGSVQRNVRGILRTVLDHTGYATLEVRTPTLEDVFFHKMEATA